MTKVKPPLTVPVGSGHIRYYIFTGDDFVL